MILEKYNKSLSKQDYSKKPSIGGVEIVELAFFSDDGGSFCELARVKDNAVIAEHFHEFKLKQLNWSSLEPGVIKAWHVHKEQDDIWFVPPADRILVGLKDIRDSSDTVNVEMRFILGAGKPRLLFIPHGVAHGAANIYSRSMTLMYFVSHHWSADPEKNDEYRLAWDAFGKNFWEMQRG